MDVFAKFLADRRELVKSAPRKRNTSAVKHYAAGYYQRNKDKFLISASKRRYAKQATRSDLTPDQWAEALDHFGHQCAYCGALGPLQKEHVNPVSAGGAYSRSNIVPACISCNQSKKDKPLDQWFKYRQSYSDVRLLALVHWIFGAEAAQEVHEKCLV